MSICSDHGWTEQNPPICAWCRNKIGVRGDVPGNAVLTGEILMQLDGNKLERVSHFNCERHVWRAASAGLVWWLRLINGKTLALGSSRMDWAEREPWIVGA